MRNYKYFFIGLLISTNAVAVGEVNDFKVVNVRADADGRGYIKFDQPLAGTPATCISGGHNYHLSFDLNSPGGAGILSIALSAHATGKSIRARGTGNCDDYGLIEKWNYGWINN